MAKQKTQPETTEVAIIIPTELSPVLKDTKIEIGKAQQHAIAFAPSMQEYITLSAVINDLNKTNPSEMDAKRAREARLKMVKVRTGAEEIKDLRKEGIKAEGDLIQALFNVVKNSCIVTETEFQEIEKHQERQEAKRQADLADTRREILAKYGTDTSYLPLGIMTDEQFDRLVSNEFLAFNARVEAAEKVEQARIEAERIEAERQVELARLQAERIEAERLEAIRVKEELAAKEAELVKEREENAERERLRIEAENKAIELRDQLRKRFAQYAIKEITPFGFTLCADGIENKELGWFIGSRHYDGFDTEIEKNEWVKDIQDRARVMIVKKAESEKQQREIENQKAENERIAKENEAKLIQQREAAEVERQKQQAENERLAKELQAKRDAEAKEIEAKRLAQLAPDKEKINALYKSIQGFTIPEFQSNEAKEIGKLVQSRMADILTLIKTESLKLK